MCERTAWRFIPFIVDGYSSIGDEQGAPRRGDKLLNTPAVENPELIAEAARIFGSSCVVVAIDAR